MYLTYMSGEKLKSILLLGIIAMCTSSFFSFILTNNNGQVRVLNQIADSWTSELYVNDVATASEAF